MKKQRISVSLPPDMLADFKDIAETSGISVRKDLSSSLGETC